jgi:hypothetical protein
MPLTLGRAVLSKLPDQATRGTKGAFGAPFFMALSEACPTVGRSLSGADGRNRQRDSAEGARRAQAAASQARRLFSPTTPGDQLIPCLLAELLSDAA